MKQQREILRKEKETAEKIAARAFAQSYLADLVPSVFGTLSDNGYFYDPVERDVEQGFLPWLMEQVTAELDRSELGRLVLDGMLREVVARRIEVYKALDEQLHPRVPSAKPTSAAPASQEEGAINATTTDGAAVEPSTEQKVEESPAAPEVAESEQAAEKPAGEEGETEGAVEGAEPVAAADGEGGAVDTAEGGATEGGEAQE